MSGTSVGMDTCVSCVSHCQLKDATKHVWHQEHNKTCKAKEKLHPGVGPLDTTNHELGYSAMLGTHQLWCGLEIELTKSKSIKWLIENFVAVKECKTIKVADMHANTRAGLETHLFQEFGPCDEL